jgi:hypothetical protein
MRRDKEIQLDEQGVTSVSDAPPVARWLEHELAHQMLARHGQTVTVRVTMADGDPQ